MEWWWYAFAAGLVLIAAPLITGLLYWALTPPVTRGKRMVVRDMVGFVVAVLLYAWLLDSRRVEYHEGALWVLLGIGALGVGLLQHVKDKEK